MKGVASRRKKKSFGLPFPTLHFQDMLEKTGVFLVTNAAGPESHQLDIGHMSSNTSLAYGVVCMYIMYVCMFVHVCHTVNLSTLNEHIKSIC